MSLIRICDNCSGWDTPQPATLRVGVLDLCRHCVEDTLLVNLTFMPFGLLVPADSWYRQYGITPPTTNETFTQKEAA